MVDVLPPQLSRPSHNVARGASNARTLVAPGRVRRMSLILLAFALLLTAGSSAKVGRVGLPSAQTTPSGGAPIARAGAAQEHISARAPLTLADVANSYIAKMSLDDELGQLFVPTFLCCGYTRNNAAMIEQLHTGGYIVYAGNTQSAAQARALIAAANAHSLIPPLVTLDEEGGGVDRLKAIYGPRPSARQIAASHSASYAQAQGAQVGRDMAALGFNVNFAPDVDVQVVVGPDLGSRNFGTTPQVVTPMAGAYLTGLQNSGVVGTLKHFPGLGGATIDAHASLPLIQRTRAQIEAVELAPYRDLIATGQVQCVMTTDLLMPALDPIYPAELSPTIVNGVLRHDLGYDGVVVTDALYMRGVTDRYSMPEAGVLAILAGNDMLEGPMTPGQMSEMENALKAALSSGRLTKERIDQSVRRILILKMRMGLIHVPISQLIAVPALGSMRLVDGPLPLGATLAANPLASLSLASPKR